MSELKPGDRVWIRGFYVEWATDNTRHISDLDDPETAIPDVPNLAAVARVLADRPEWQNYSEALNRLVAITKLCSAMLFLHGQIDPNGDHYQELVARLDDPTLVHDWEAADALAAALNGATE